MKKILSLILVTCSLLGGNAYANEVKLTCIGDEDPVITELKLYPKIGQGTLYSLTTGPISKTRLVTSEDRYDFYYTIHNIISAKFSINRTTGKYIRIWAGEDGKDTLIVYGSCKKSSPKF